MLSAGSCVPGHSYHCRKHRDVCQPHRHGIDDKMAKPPFKHKSKRNDTELSKHLWQPKDQKKDFAVSWKILAKAKSYSNLTKRCNLCNTEEFYIQYKPDMATLNHITNLQQLAGTSESFSLNSLAPSRTNHEFTNVYYYCSSSLNSVTIILLMYINPSDASVYMEFN